MSTPRQLRGPSARDGAPPRALAFSSDAVPEHTLSVASFTGCDAISALSAYDLDLMSTRDDLDLAALLQADAWLGITRGVIRDGGRIDDAGMLRIHGVLARIEQLDRGGGWTRYRATLVPKLWRATLASGSRVFLDKTVPEMVEQVLRDAGLPSAEYDFRLSSRRYPAREYTVQHAETDLAFASRLLEHEGISYAFSHLDDRCVVVFADAPDGRDRPRESQPYRRSAATGADDAADDWNQRESVRSLICRQTPVPAGITLQDHDWRSPDHDLRARAQVSDQATHGATYLYGEAHRDADAGSAYARIRAEEIRCRQRLYVGASDVRSLRAGSGLAIAGHPRQGVDGDYLITEIRHSGSQQLEHGGGTALRTSYANEFTCIPFDTIFRPARTTPKPRIPGTLHAVIDSAGSGDYAELDDAGRYRVKLPLDLEDRGAGNASRPVRMAQPYAGTDMGMHFPLHKGTQVLLTHVNGDPDRPIIAGAVPDALTPSVVAGRNQTQCVLRSGGGNEVRLEDSKNAEIFQVTAKRDLALAIGNDRREQVGQDQALTVKRDRKLDVGRDQCASIDGAATLRVGKDSTTTIAGSAKRQVDGKDVLEVHGHRVQDIRQDLKEMVGGAMEVTVAKHLRERVHGDRGESTDGARSATARSILLNADDELTLRAGAASITLKKDGSIVISGKDISLRSAGMVKIRAAKDVAIKGAKVVGN